MINPKKFGAQITVISSGASYHTFNNWHCTITNNDYIGDVVKEENYINVPGMVGKLDYTESISGRPIYKSRPLNIELSGAHSRYEWDAQISTIRNAIDGRRVKVTFDNDTSHYWVGRASVVKFDRNRQLGAFAIEIPEADPYKYDINTSGTGSIGIADGETITIPAGTMSVVPIITVTDLISDMTVAASGVTGTFALSAGENRFPQIRVCGDTAVTLTFTGYGNLSIDYRGGSL